MVDEPMRRKWMELIKEYILTGGKALDSFKQALQIFNEDIKNSENNILIKLEQNLKILYDIAEKNDRNLYWQMFNKREVFDCITELHSKNFIQEALFLQVIYMFYNFAFQGYGGSFTKKTISYKTNMSAEEYKTELTTYEKNAYAFIEGVLWFHDLGLMNYVRALIINTLESIREIYIELGMTEEAIGLYTNLDSWLKDKKSYNKEWLGIFKIYPNVGKGEIYAALEEYSNAENFFSLALSQIERYKEKEEIQEIKANIISHLTRIREKEKN